MRGFTMKLFFKIFFGLVVSSALFYSLHSAMPNKNPDCLQTFQCLNKAIEPQIPLGCIQVIIFDYWNNMPLFNAIRSGNAEEFKRCLNSGYDLNESETRFIKSSDLIIDPFIKLPAFLLVIGRAAYHPSYINHAMVAACLDSKNPLPLNINMTDNRGQTALHIGIMANNTELVSLLLEQKNIDINAKTIDGKNILEYAKTSNKAIQDRIYRDPRLIPPSSIWGCIIL
jgi:hypothetical protein